MGPMGPMMGGWWQGSGVPVWELLAPTVVLFALVAAIGFALWRASGPPTEHRPRSAEEILHARFARGELTREQYREALVDLLRGRYVRGEIDLDTYEVRIRRLFGTEHSRPDPLTEDRQRVRLSDESPRDGIGPTEGGSR